MCIRDRPIPLTPAPYVGALAPDFTAHLIKSASFALASVADTERVMSTSAHEMVISITIIPINSLVV